MEKEWNPTNPDPERLLGMAYHFLRQERNRYFIEEKTVLEVEDAAQDLVLYILEEMQKGRILKSPAVAYAWMVQEFQKWKSREYRREGYSHHEYLVSMDEMHELTLEDTRVSSDEGSVETYNQHNPVDPEQQNMLDEVDLSTNVIDLTEEGGFLDQLLALLELEKFWDGRESDILAEALNTTEHGSGTSQFLRDFRRRKVGTPISYTAMTSGIIYLEVGEDEDVRIYRLYNDKELN